MTETVTEPRRNGVPDSFAPLSESFARDPYTAYAELRECETPPYFEAMDCHLLARFEPVDAVARNPVMVRSLEAYAEPAQIRSAQISANFHDMPYHEQFVQFSMLERDGDVHRRLRMVVLREFSKQLIERHRGMIERHVSQLLDRLLSKRDIDFVEDLAAQVPGHVIGQLLGVPAEDCQQLRIWSENIVQYFDADRTEENKQLAESATGEFYFYLKDLIQERRKRPADDLLTTLVRATDAGDLTEQELVSTSLLILVGGHGSTIDVLGTGMLALIQHPDQLQRLRDEPNLIQSAVQEMFRYDSPLPFFHRYASGPVEVMGRQYPRGTKFGLLYGAANRDPGNFSNPDCFDITRTPNRHLAFGRGAHLCLGNNLARLDMEVIFLSLLARVSRFELMTEQAAFRTGLASRGLVRLPLRLTPK